MEATELPLATELLMPAKRLNPLTLVEIVPSVVAVADEDLLRLRLCGSEHHNRSSQKTNRENLCDHPFYVCEFHDALFLHLNEHWFMTLCFEQLSRRAVLY